MTLGRERALRSLEFTVTRRLEGFLHGDYAGLRSGPGSEPDEARLYVPGQDDVRRMDWNVTARTAEPYVRSPLAERELETWALVDASASMDFGTVALEKRDLAVAIVAAIGMLAERPGNRLGVRVAYGNELTRSPGRGGALALRHTLRTLLALPRLEPGAHPSTDLASAITRLHREHLRPGLRIVVSDFLSGTSWERPLRWLAARHDVIAVEIVDPRELDLPEVGLLTLVDPETGRRREVHTSSRLRRRYASAASEHRAENAAAFRRAGAAHLLLRTDTDWVRDVAAFVRARRRTRSRPSKEVR